MKTYNLDINSSAPTIKEQLEKQEVYMKERDYEKYENIRHAITMLYFHISTPSEYKRNVERFYKKIQKDIYDEKI